MMERMFKRVSSHSNKKTGDPEKTVYEENEELTCSTVASKTTSDWSPESGDPQWCDLLSFKSVCAEPADVIEHQLANDEPIRRPRRLRVFNFHYLDSHIMEFKPRAITRRLCGGRKHDNELYRSNSFKFERFERLDEGTSLQKQVSLCDEYSLPVDFVNQRQPHSFGAGLANWTTPSPSGDQVEIVGAYCDPRDSKAYLEPGEEASGKLYTSPDRDYSQPYIDGSSVAKEPGEEDDGVYEDVGLPSEGTVASAEEPRRNPSPYYYSDLFRDCGAEDDPSRRPATGRYRKCVSLDTPSASCAERVGRPKRNSVAGDGSGETLSLVQHEDMPPHRPLPSACACAGAAQCVRDADDDGDDEAVPPRYLLRDARCHGPLPLEEPLDYDDMSGRQRHVYETAFDCKVSRSDDDLDDVDRVTNHPILQMLGSSKVSSSNVRPVRPGSSKDPSSLGIFTPKERRKLSLVRAKLVKERPKAILNRISHADTASSTTTLSQELEELEIDGAEGDEAAPPLPLPLRGYSPSPPSTAPLPAKFHGKEDLNAMNSIRSAPNLPAGSPAHPRLKDARLPIKSLRAREGPLKGSILEFKGRPQSMLSDGGPILEFKGRPRQDGLILEFKGRPRSGDSMLDYTGRPRMISQESGPILEFKGRPSIRRCGIRPKYSSTESMATSSSGGSLESIRSSTSEGNRSTTSSESHRSSSLSSHSSDSASSCGSTGSATGNLHHLHHLHHYYHHHQCSSVGTPHGVVSGGRFFAHQSNKLHILSPISDKSSQEPVSETSDNNRNNNSQKASPEDTDQFMSPASTAKFPLEQPGTKMKRRALQNKNLIHLSLQQQSSGEGEVLGSDSGISIEPQAPDLSDLPFDMPKLRRRRLLQQDTCTSGSATSVDLHDLPFDMPKLRRRLRGPQEPNTSTESSGVSQASSSQSVQEGAQGRPGLTLNLDGSPRKRLGLCLDLGQADTTTLDVQLPLERQGWYHGAITRLEAENVLRLLQEGSYLVRNSESTRQDYSLSLKSARGFMHMRIQQSKELGKFILGQFSKPFDSIPEMIQHYTVNRLPIRGAEHMCLLHPVIEQLL